MDNQLDGTIVAEFAKNSRDKVRVVLREYHGTPLVDVRTYYEDDAGAWKPGRGISLRRELLGKLLAGLTKAQKLTRETEAKPVQTTICIDKEGAR
jgi:hypothetical protein